jgi:hypothetical protein
VVFAIHLQFKYAGVDPTDQRVATHACACGHQGGNVSVKVILTIEPETHRF